VETTELKCASVCNRIAKIYHRSYRDCVRHSIVCFYKNMDCMCKHQRIITW